MRFPGKTFVFITLLFFNASVALAHDIHVSVLDIYRSDEGKLECIVRIFYDDLLAAVGLVPGEELPPDYTSSDDLIHKYINSNLEIKINGQTVLLNYIESTPAMPAIWTTLQIADDNIDSVLKEISIDNRILTDLFDDQTNMVNVDVDDTKKYFVLDKDNKKYPYY